MFVPLPNSNEMVTVKYVVDEKGVKTSAVMVKGVAVAMLASVYMMM